MSFFSRPGPGPRLICLPSAGGGTADFRRWKIDCTVMPACLPGRERRLSERPYRSMAPLVEDLADALPVEVPFSLYGHSMGAWIAFELVRELRRRELPLPDRLLVGARRAPHLPSALPALGRLSRAAFLDGMQQHYGAIPQVLLDSPELMDTFLPALRADVLLLDDYGYREQAPLDLPLHVFCADDDPTVTASEVEAWRLHTTGAFRVHRVSGGHFFHREPQLPARLAPLLQ